MMDTPIEDRVINGLKENLIKKLRDTNCIQSTSVEEAFRAIPRHLFLPGVVPERIYSDQAILTKRLDGKAVSSSSQPAIMAIMLEQLQLQPGHHVLEIGTGTGYNAGLMGHLVGKTGTVVTVDIDEDLVESARDHLIRCLLNVKILSIMERQVIKRSINSFSIYHLINPIIDTKYLFL